MTEEEWLKPCTPERLIHSLEAKTSGRKLRLYAVACCRSVLALLGDTSRSAVEVAERLADGEASDDELSAAVAAVKGPHGTAEPTKLAAMHTASYFVSANVIISVLDRITSAVGDGVVMRRVGHDFTEWEIGQRQCAIVPERATQAALVRDIFGKPFRPVTFAPEWRTDTVVALARTMYESREFSAMPILADALQDAGCDNEDVLNHCRGTGPHVRGCWVCDLALGKV